MWKRENETTPENANPTPAGPAPRPQAPSAPPRASESSSVSSPSGGRGVIGASTVVRGEISGEEDLLIEGRVEGKVDLRQNAVTIGAKGRLSAEVVARAIQIDGEVDGDLTAEEQIVLRKGGRVRGDLTAPRITIEDGARFKGSIDMEPKRSSSSASAGTSSSASSSSSSAKPAANVSKPDPVASLAAAASGSSGPKS